SSASRERAIRHYDLRSGCQGSARILTRYYSGVAMAVSVTSKGQVTIPKRVREALGITPGSKVEFDVVGGGARIKLVNRHTSSCVEEGAAILDYRGPKIPVDKMHGGTAMKKAAKRARR